MCGEIIQNNLLFQRFVLCLLNLSKRKVRFRSRNKQYLLPQTKCLGFRIKKQKLVLSKFINNKTFQQFNSNLISKVNHNNIPDENNILLKLHKQ